MVTKTKTIMRNKEFMELKLGVVRQFQEMFPTSHIGGSMGLYLRGINLGRDLTYSDLDMIMQEYDPEKHIIENESWCSKSCFDDFVAAYDVIFADKYGYYYCKLEISERPEQLYDVIEFMGNKYKVSKLSHIFEFKKMYADRGHEKHQRDLHFIALQRKTPAEYWYSQAFTLQDDDNSLPF